MLNLNTVDSCNLGQILQKNVFFPQKKNFIVKLIDNIQFNSNYCSQLVNFQLYFNYFNYTFFSVNANESENDEDYYFNNKTLAIYSVIFIR